MRREIAASGLSPSDEAISGALETVRSRYRQRLSYLGLTESYYDETAGICDLMLWDVSSWTKYEIVYYRATGMLEWPRMMTKGLAEDLLEDRMLMDTYEKALGK